MGKQVWPFHHGSCDNKELHLTTYLLVWPAQMPVPHENIFSHKLVVSGWAVTLQSWYIYIYTWGINSRTAPHSWTYFTSHRRSWTYLHKSTCHFLEIHICLNELWDIFSNGFRLNITSFSCLEFKLIFFTYPVSLTQVTESMTNDCMIIHAVNKISKTF